MQGPEGYWLLVIACGQGKGTFGGGAVSLVALLCGLAGGAGRDVGQSIDPVEVRGSGVKQNVSKWLTPRSANEIPDLPGVYVLILDKAWIYVGSTSSLAKRLRQHNIRKHEPASYLYTVEDAEAKWLTPWGSCRTVKVKIRPTQKFGEWLMIEARLIKRLQPHLNSRGAGGNKAAEKYRIGSRVRPVVEFVAASLKAAEFDK